MDSTRRGNSSTCDCGAPAGARDCRLMTKHAAALRCFRPFPAPGRPGCDHADTINDIHRLHIMRQCGRRFAPDAQNVPAPDAKRPGIRVAPLAFSMNSSLVRRGTLSTNPLRLKSSTTPRRSNHPPGAPDENPARKRSWILIHTRACGITDRTAPPVCRPIRGLPSCSTTRAARERMASARYFHSPFICIRFLNTGC